MQKIYCIGDCMTAGVGDKGKIILGYPYFLQKKLGKEYEVINNGRTMMKAETILKFPSKFAYNEIENGDIACVWCGTNDLFVGAPPNVFFSRFEKYCSLLIDKGVHIIALTFLPRSNRTPLGFEDNRLKFNDMIRNVYTHVADVAKDERIGLAGCEKNQEYYCEKDTTHPNEKGYEIVAEIVAKEIKKLQKKLAKNK